MRRPVAKLALTAVAAALLCVLALTASSGSATVSTTSATTASSTSGGSAPICVPDTTNASARLPGTPLLVTPAPDTRDAMPQTQLSFLGGGGDLSALAVHGSISGAHDGSLERYSQGDGASFVPSAPFVAGEIVSVSGVWTSAGSGHPFAYTFTVGDPDPIQRLPEPATPAGPSTSVLHFVSAPGIDPPALTVTVNSPAARRDGDIFIAAYPGPGAIGPAIFDPDGRLVWFKPLPPGQFATNVRVQRYQGQPVLTWWQGVISRHGFGYGEGQIYSTSYRRIATVTAGDGLAEDLHELSLEPNGTALITAWKPLYCDLEGVGGPALGAVYDASFQEVDIRTGLVRYEWDSLDHVPLTDSYMPAAGAKTAWPYDWFHLNSIAVDGGGDLLISARSTWAVYDIDAATGVIQWQLGGRRPTFAMGPGTQTAWQHDAQPLGPDTISLFDNGGPPSPLRHSRGLVLRIDPGSRTAALVRSVAIKTPIFAQTQGDLQLLPDGNWWIGWGNVNESSEVSAAGTQLFEAHTPAGSESYRTFRYQWSARPATRPQAVVRRAANGAPAVYVSWNGATGVARWRLEAGHSPAALAVAGGAASAGFETMLAAPRSAAVVRAVALDAHGHVLGASLPVTVPR